MLHGKDESVKVDLPAPAIFKVTLEDGEGKKDLLYPAVFLCF